jgi:uncharacterized protein (DUF305 family)
MGRSVTPPRRAALLLVVFGAGCAAGGARVEAPPRLPPVLGAAAETARQRPAHTDADVHFMTAMIPHHAQAVKMAQWVAARSTRPDLRILAERMEVAQRDEIDLLRTWLADRGLPVPAADATHHRMLHGDMAHDMLMPGMLTAGELARLEQARGVEFDRLFLTFMIRHHEGAVIMVNELFESAGGGQDDFVFKLAADIFADQLTEIDRMQQMLASLPPDARRP